MDIIIKGISCSATACYDFIHYAIPFTIKLFKESWLFSQIM